MDIFTRAWASFANSVKWFASNLGQALKGAVHSDLAMTRVIFSVMLGGQKGIKALTTWASSELSRLEWMIIHPWIEKLQRLIKHDFRILWARDWRLHQRAAAYARQQDKALHQLIEREAASGYRAQYQGRLVAITGILAHLITRVPFLRNVLNKIIGGVIDLIGVEDPVARWVITVLMTRVVGRLGVDKAAGEFAQSLLTPILGQPKPRDIHDVINDMSARLNAMESQWARFFADGGSQVEQAGKEWQAVTGPLTDVALLAFFGAAVADPGVWAKDVQATIGRPVEAVLMGAADLIKRA